jgi:hypothetical protein
MSPWFGIGMAPKGNAPIGLQTDAIRKSARIKRPKIYKDADKFNLVANRNSLIQQHILIEFVNILMMMK